MLEVLCRNCDEAEYTPHPYTISLVQSALLLEAGFPVKADTFPMGYWLDLGIVRTRIKQKSMQLF